MTKTERAMLHRAADIIARYADDLRRENIVNGAWLGTDAASLNMWAEMTTIVVQLRFAAERRHVSDRR